MRGSQALLRGGLVVLGLVGAAVAPAREGVAQSRPNVLIIVTDDQRHSGTLEVMPKTRAWLKRGGTSFSHAFSTTPLCCPARASIMTGRYAHNHMVQAHTRPQVLRLDHRDTVQRYLSEAGYRTGIFGKFLNKWPLERDPPFFDTWAIYSKGNPYYTGRYNVQGKVRQVDRYWSKYMRARAAEFLKSTEDEDDRPWFMYLAPTAPHGPTVPQQRYRRAKVGSWHGNRAVFEQDRTDKPPFVQIRNADLYEGRRVRRNQLRAILSIDDLMGRVSRKLKELGEKDTLVFFLSDNGEMWAEHGLLGKTWPYSYSIDIPFLVRWPGHFEAGKTQRRIVANIDVAPTILDAAGVVPAHTIDGRSLLQSFFRERLLVEYWRSPDFDTPSWASLLRSNEQYIEYYDAADATTYREYYNLDKDPWQLRNLLGDINPLNDPNVLELSRRLAEDRECSGGSCP